MSIIVIVLLVVGAILYGFITMLFGFSVGKIKSAEDKAGILWINQTEEKDQYKFIFTAPLDDLPTKKKVWLEVRVAEKTGYLIEE